MSFWGIKEGHGPKMRSLGIILELVDCDCGRRFHARDYRSGSDLSKAVLTHLAVQGPDLDMLRRLPQGGYKTWQEIGISQSELGHLVKLGYAEELYDIDRNRMLYQGTERTQRSVALLIMVEGL